MDSRLDTLLDLTREPEPFDDGFVDSIMRRVHAGSHRPARRRFFARPLVMATAGAVVVAGAAVGMIVRSSVTPPEPGVTLRATEGTTVTARPPSSAEARSDGSAQEPSVGGTA